MNAAAVRSTLGLGESYRPWTEALEAAEPATQVTPSTIAVNDALLDRLQVPVDERPHIRAALADLDQPAYQWLLERAAGRLLAAMGSPESFDPGAALPPGLGPAAQWFHVAVFLACFRDVRAHHFKLGIPDDISCASLAELGNKIDIQRRLVGTGGCRQYMVQLAFRGIFFWLGRLQYNLTRPTAGGPLGVAVHIPETGRLDPRTCEESYERAADFFARYFPASAQDGLVGSCHSWLLDPQLQSYLPHDANILRFQRRYTLTDAAPEPADDAGLTAGDRSIIEFVFRRVIPGRDFLGALRPRTTLEHAIVSHLRSGHHWQIRDGHTTITAP